MGALRAVLGKGKALKASIIIRCKDEAATIGRVLEGVFSQSCDTPFDVLVIDSGSTDGTLEILSMRPVELIRIKPEEFGFGYTMNLGAKRATGDILVYLSAHCPPVDGNWLKPLLAPFSDPAVAGSYGRQVPDRGVNPFEEWRFARAFPAGPERPQPFMFSNSSAAIRRSVWEEAPFDESLPASEDRQWAKAVEGAGHRVAYVPESVVYHSHPFSLSWVRGRAYITGWAKKKIYGESCRFDSAAWVAGAYSYCVVRDLLHFLSNGYLEYVRFIPRYRYLELKGFYQGARDCGKGLINLE